MSPSKQMSGEPIRLRFASSRAAFGGTREFLMLVKTYPLPSKSYGETVCCAGIDAQTGSWVRIYPVNFRSLQEFKQFKKWQFMTANWRLPTNDKRPESLKIQQDSITIGPWLPPGAGWKRRRPWLQPLVDRSLESLVEEQTATGKSLGMIRPKRIRAFKIRPAKAWGKESVKALDQLTLGWTDADPVPSDLEILPFDFLYTFECDDVRCSGHEMEIFDWEVGAAYRHFRRKYGRGWKGKLTEKYGQELPSRDLHLLLGTHHLWGSWMIVGVIAPPHAKVREAKARTIRKRHAEVQPMTLPFVEFKAQQSEDEAAGSPYDFIQFEINLSKGPAVEHAEPYRLLLGQMA